MQEETIKDTALVIEGGGFRGIFAAGVLEVFLKHQLFFEYAIGVSAGASYGVSYVSRQEGRNLVVNRYISDVRYSSLRNLIRDGSLFSWDFIFREMPMNIVPFDYNAFNNSTTRFWAGVANCKTGESEYFCLNQTNTEGFKDILAATCSLPFIAPIVDINHNQYLDGGLTDSIPFEKALADGNQRVVVILTRPKGYIKDSVKYPGFVKWYYRKYPKVAELIISRAENYNNAIKKLEELERTGKAFIIRPEKEIIVSRLENKPEKTEKAYHLAMAEMEKQIESLKHWLKN